MTAHKKETQSPILSKPELPPPLRCKTCGKENRRYATKDNGKGKRYYNLVCCSCRGSERRRQIRLINDPVRTAKLYEQDRRHRLKSKFGITIEEYHRLLDAQGNVCGICKKPNKKKTFMPVDHDHKTGKVRGVLCENCNNGLGRFYDNPEALREAINYLERHDGIPTF